MNQSHTNTARESDPRHGNGCFEPHLERVLTRFSLLAQRRAAWPRNLWSEEGKSADKVVVTHADMDTHLEGRDRPELGHILSDGQWERLEGHGWTER